MSEKITLEQFEEKVENEMIDEINQLNKRQNELTSMFLKLANSVVAKEGEDEDDFEEEFRDTVYDYACHFIGNIDYDYSTVEPGNVQIWEASTC